MKIFKRIVIVLSVISILVFVGFGYAVGFPWERITAANVAKKYVIETYGLTPTKAIAHFLFDEGDNGVYVSTKELPFDFDVGVSRRGLTADDNDNYLKCLFEYKLEQAIRNSVKGLLDENCKIYACTNNPLTRQAPDGLSIESINTNPNEAFRKLKGEYWIYISYINVSKKNFKIDTINNEKNYRIIKKLLEKWQPESVDIDYSTSKKDTMAKADINSEDFNKIKSPKDLNGYFKLPTH